MQISNNEWKSKYFYSSSAREQYCLICKKKCQEDQICQIDIWNNHLISEDHLQILYNQLQTKSILNDPTQQNTQEQIDQISLFDYSLAKSVFEKGGLQCSIYCNYQQMNTLIAAYFNYQRQKLKEIIPNLIIAVFQGDFIIFFSERKGLVQRKRFAYVFKFKIIQRERYISDQVIAVINVYNLLNDIGKQLSVSAKKQIKNNIHQKSEFEQASTQNYVISFEKLLKQMIVHEQERNALMLYLLFEFDLDIYDIPYLKFDAI